MIKLGSANFNFSKELAVLTRERYSTFLRENIHGNRISRRVFRSFIVIHNSPLWHSQIQLSPDEIKRVLVRVILHRGASEPGIEAAEPVSISAEITR